MLALLDPVFAHPRVVGSRPRGVALIATAVLLSAVGGYCISRAAPFGASSIWTWLAVITLVPALVALLAGVSELRRPLLVGGPGRRSGASDATLHWHPKFTEIVADLRFVVQPAWIGLQELVAEADAGRMNGRLVLEGAPFAVGSRAKMSFAVKSERGVILDFAVTFRLRCLRESPHGMLRLQSAIECLADLAPSGREHDLDLGVFRLEFDLPPGLPGSDLCAAQPVYWELTVDISDPGPFRVRKFIPVTDRVLVSS